MLKIEGKLKINGRDVKGHHTPTEDFKDDLISTIGDTSAWVLGQLDKVCIVDGDGHEDCASLASGDMTVDTGAHKLTVDKVVTYTGTQGQIVKVRLYSGTKLYFEYTLDTPVDVSTNQSVRVIYEITITLTTTMTDVTMEGNYNDEILKRLAQQSTLSHGGAVKAQLWDPDAGTITEQSVTTSVDLSANKATCTFKYTPDTDKTYTKLILLLGPDGADIRWSHSTTQSLSAGVEYTFEMTISI